MAESEITTTTAREGAIKNQLELKHHVRWHLKNIVKWQNNSAESGVAFKFNEDRMHLLEGND